MKLRTPVLTILLVSAALPAARAQATTGPAVLYATPGARALATVTTGTVLDPGTTSGEYVHVNLRGYIATNLLGAKRDSFPASVNATGARLRATASASATVVAAVEQGMGVRVLKRVGTWTQVERAGWIRRARLSAAPVQHAPSKPAPNPTSSPASSDTLSPPTTTGAVTAADTAGLSPAPGVAAVATVKRGAVLIPLARDRGWVRVRLEGWVREGALVAADSSTSHLTAADLRVSPDLYVGKVVRWAVTSLAFQTADPLRRDMRPNEPYLLARGPGSENALLYLAIPPALVEKAKALSPMTKLVVTAKIRIGRADPSGVPILDVQTMTTTR